MVNPPAARLSLQRAFCLAEVQILVEAEPVLQEFLASQADFPILA